MERTIGAKELRARLPAIVARARRGERFTVLYRSRPAFRIVPSSAPDLLGSGSLEEEPLYRAGAVGRSTDGLSSWQHDALIYRLGPGRARR